MEFLQDNLRVFVVPVDIMNVPNLTIHEQMAYIVIRSYCNPHELTAFPSYKTIAEKGRMSRRKAIDAVASLVEKGLLQKKARFDKEGDKIRHTSNLYQLKSPQKPDAPDALGSAPRAPKQNQLTKSMNI